MKIQILQSNNLEELKELIAVFEEVFEMKNFRLPPDEHLQKLLEKATYFPVIAKIENKIVGGLTVYILDQYYSQKPLAYIYDLAVLTEYQRKGVGKSLIEFTINYCKSMGFEQAFVQAEKIDDYAIDFYRLTKPTTEEQVLHFTYIL